MITIVLMNTKGGAGKTTIASALAVRAAKEFKRVALIDLDPQKSLIGWWRRRGQSDNPCILEGPELASEAVERLMMTGWDVAIIDTPPAFFEVLTDAANTADLIVIPLRPSVLDLMSTQDAVVLAREAKAAHLVVINAAARGDKRRIEETRDTLFGGSVPMAKTVIQHRASHINGMTVGKSAAEVDGGKDKAAAEEVDALWKEVFAAAQAAIKAKSGGA